MSIVRFGGGVVVSDETFTSNDDFIKVLKMCDPRYYATASLYYGTGAEICFKDCVFNEVKFERVSDEPSTVDWNEFYMFYNFQCCRFNNATLTFAELGDSALFTHCNGIINFVACECKSLNFAGGNLNIRFNTCKIGNLTFNNNTARITKVRIDDFVNSCIGATWVPENKDAYVVILPSDFAPRCPKSGAFTAYKKGLHVFGCEQVMITLEIPEDAKRTSGLSNKCRCDKAIVKSITGISSGESYDCALSMFTTSANGQLLYEVGETVVPDFFDEEGLRTCTNGIHFFMSKEEAMEY